MKPNHVRGDRGIDSECFVHLTPDMSQQILSICKACALVVTFAPPAEELLLAEFAHFQTCIRR